MRENEQVSVRELRQNLARYLEAAHNGETITITRTGRPDAQLGPIGRSIDYGD